MDEEETKAKVVEQLMELPKGKLKEACKQMGLSTAGDRDELVARIVEKMNVAEEDDDEEDDDEEEEEEEEAPAAKGKAKASPETTKGPVKTIAKGGKAVKGKGRA